METKSKVLIIGGTGHLGKRLVKASLEQGHETYVLQRPDVGVNIEKVQMLLSFKKHGAHLVNGSFHDHQSLVDAVKQVDVVICAMSGDFHISSHPLLLQLKLVAAIKEAGNVKVKYLYACTDVPIFVDEDDIAAYTIKTIDDPRTLNKTLYIRPPANILSQRQLVEIWEKLIGKVLKKSSLSEKQFLDSLKEKDYIEQAAMTHFYHFFYEGCLANFEIGDDAEEASDLYPDIKYTRVEDYLKQYI
ncbi:hypothetical protein M8C21_015882 [Ambrosia artemisiifolia]|uniref:(+)-lariciresinol reductase n=1 Tax=Ambrosia artemisiifolia TaxID=4212 RepID=A0AAD5GU76_AMBAR|nr:hypothetical protein M8C21_015882 [Ambrosia artemisiifolia]